MFYFLNSKPTRSFFSRWFHRVGWKAVLYDIILVCSVYVMMMILSNKIKNNTK